MEDPEAPELDAIPEQFVEPAPKNDTDEILARVARLGVADAGTLAQLLGQRRFDRFGDSFLEILRED